MNKILIFGIIAFILLMIGLGLSSYFMCYSKGKGYVCNPFDNKPGAVSGIKIVKVESFTDKIQLQMQDDQSYKIYWPDVSNKGNGDPKNFFYQYFVWKGSNPTFTSSNVSPPPDQTGKTPTPSFILNPDLNSSPQITVIITANNEFGASADALQILSLQQAPSIKSANFNASSIINGLLIQKPIVDIELGSLGGDTEANTTVQSYINVNSDKVNSTKCSSVSDKKAQCFFDLTDKDLYGGNNYLINAFAKNSTGQSSIYTGSPVKQKEITPTGVIPGDIQIDNSFQPVSLKFRIKYSAVKPIYMMYDKTQNWFIGTSDKTKASIFGVDPNGKYKELNSGLYLNANPNASTIQLKEFIETDSVFYEWTIIGGNMYLTKGTAYGNATYNVSAGTFIWDKNKDPNFSLESA